MTTRKKSAPPKSPPGDLTDTGKESDFAGLGETIVSDGSTAPPPDDIAATYVENSSQPVAATSPLVEAQPARTSEVRNVSSESKSNAPGGGTSDAGQPAGQSSGKKKVTQLGDFKLVRKLGQGGMGTVFLAKQVSLDRDVALKTLSADLAKKEQFVQRFLRESRSMARLQHPNIVQVYAAESRQGFHYAAIEFIDGQSMQDWMDQLKRLSIGDAVHVVMTCADALKHAHDLNMIHRDIKPDNILVTSKGVIKVADFGLAKAVDEDVSMTQSGTGLGTPLYMAPEQARNAKHVDQRTDIYALGAMLYYFVTGELPFKGDNTLELITAKEKGIFTAPRKFNPEVPERMELVIDKMMARNPQHRYTNCAEVINDLENLALESPALSFIANAEGNVRRTGGPRTSAAMTQGPGAVTQRPGAMTQPGAALPRSSAEDAARQAPQPKVKEKVWYVKHKSGGKTTLTKMTTQQVLRAVKSDALDTSAQAKTSAKGDFLPLAQYPEFADSMGKRATRAKVQERGKDMADVYAQLDKQHQRRHRWLWLKRLVGSVKGGTGLILWLAVVFGVIGLGGYLIWHYFGTALQNFIGGG